MRTGPESYRTSHLHKSDDYHQVFESMPRAAMLWTLEKNTLDRIMTDFFGSQRPDHLDFACGTGRILTYLEAACRTSTGIDVSKRMLSVARRNSPTAELLCADITRDNVLSGRGFDLITAFRFFPNAEASLRREAVDILVRLLRPNGILILNNHLNATAILRSALKITGRQSGHKMWKSEVCELLEGGGLKITRTVGVGILPVTDRQVFAPRAMTHLEAALTRTRAFDRFAEDEIFIARHVGAV